MTQSNGTAIYTGGDAVSYEGRRYRAIWWTKGEFHGNSDVWEDLGIVDGSSAKQYETLMLALAEPLHAEGKC